MKGDLKSNDYLTAALRFALTAVSQYWLHYRLQEDWAISLPYPAQKAPSR